MGERKFRELSIDERIAYVKQSAGLTDEESSLLGNFGTLGQERALYNENAIGVYDNLTLGLAEGLVVNGKEYEFLPMAIEEPSVIAAQSNANKIMKKAGGFKASVSEPWYMFSQVQIVKEYREEWQKASDIDAIWNDKQNLLKIANDCDPKLVSVGGGARDISVRYVPSRIGGMLITHLYVDTKDAMGANAVNTMAEAIAPRLEELTGGKVYLRILSNLADKRLARAEVKIPKELLAIKAKVEGEKELSGEEVARGIEIASAFAEADPYRTATHNKGAMNAISAIAVAMGQDWRALEAGAHEYPYVAKKYGYSLSKWYTDDGFLYGELEMPCAVGIVGGAAAVNPLAKLSRKIAKIDSAAEMAQVMAAAGLAQNFSAIKALSTDGIQKGHMRLHARNVAIGAGAKADQIDYVTQQMIKNRKIRQDYAEELLKSLNGKN